MIELVAALAIVGVLTGIMISGGRYALGLGTAARARAEIAGLSAALESYRRAFGDYPRTNHPDELLQALIGHRGPTGAVLTGRSFIAIANFRTDAGPDPFVAAGAQLLDPWSTPYVYAYRSEVPWTNIGYVLYSCGPDAESSALLSGGLIDGSSVKNVDNIYGER